MKIKDIPKFARDANYCIDLTFDELKDWVARQLKHNLDINPDFQRAHVWKESDQIAFIEFVLSGGLTGKDLYFNMPGWQRNYEGDFVLVDGKQRLTAILRFINNEIPAFNCLLNDFDNPKLLLMRTNVKIHVNNLATRKECLQWYINFNQGGIVHTEEEISKVIDLINLED